MKANFQSEFEMLRFYYNNGGLEHSIDFCMSSVENEIVQMKNNEIPVRENNRFSSEFAGSVSNNAILQVNAVPITV